MFIWRSYLAREVLLKPRPLIDEQLAAEGHPFQVLECENLGHQSTVGV
jgi:hypothetical protein